jgi:hypothetical protein
LEGQKLYKGIQQSTRIRLESIAGRKEPQEEEEELEVRACEDLV